MSINAYAPRETETPEQTAHLDSVVHSGTDGLILHCLDEVGKITYREALKRYAELFPKETI